MAPYNPNLLSPNRTGGSTTAPERSASTSPARPRASSRLTSDDVLNHAYGIPTLQPPSGSSPRHGHGRSLSHPFPSLFSSRKKRSEEKITTAIESSDDDDILAPPAHRSEGSGNTTKYPEKTADGDLITGKCMTCDSTVRWPKALPVFRCSICLTINDLKPLGDGSSQSASRGGQGSVRRKPVGGRLQQVPPLSTARMNALIEQCVTSYLIERLKHIDANSPATHNSSPCLQEATNQLEITATFLPRFDDHQTTTSVPPITISQQSRGRWQNRCDESSENGPSVKPYLSSTPGSYDSHMRSRMQGQQSLNAPTRPPPPPPDARDRDAQHRDPHSRPRTPSISISAAKSIFKPVEEYIIDSFTSRECINTSFSTVRPQIASRAVSEEGNRTTKSPLPEDKPHHADTLSELDAKTLLVGDIAENGSWWTGRRTGKKISDRPRLFATEKSLDGSVIMSEPVNIKSPHIDWADMDSWYHVVLCPGKNWERQLDSLVGREVNGTTFPALSSEVLAKIAWEIQEAQEHVQRVLLKAIETLLKRPGAPLKRPADVRFLLIVLANPLLYPSHHSVASHQTKSRSNSGSLWPPQNAENIDKSRQGTPIPSTSSVNGNNGPGRHSGIIKRVLGLLSNLPNECHHYLVSWFTRFPESHFQKAIELIGSFVTYRLTRQHGRKANAKHDATAGLIPTMSASGHNSSAALHAALGLIVQPAKKKDDASKSVVYNDDWQIKAAARVMSLFFSANKSGLVRKESNMPLSMDPSHSVGVGAHESARRHGHIVATSSFYNTLLDYSDLVADFEAWEKKKSKFAFCQYPFFLSIWAKIQIMEYDAKRQMELKAREAFFDSILTRKVVQQYLILNVRRECLVEDSLAAVSEVVGSSGEEIKKGLRIQFRGEEGIDAGGLRKEWFLLLVRDVFNPEHGMFIYDEDSQFCYFNPNSFETTDQFFLVGVVLGLAIYNSTILDVALPPFAFKKLLAAGPTVISGATAHSKPTLNYTLDDLAEFRPRLAHGLQQLLDYEGDVETTFCRDFVADIERYGQITQIPLCSNGARRPVTNANRKEFVDLYVRYLLDTAVARQFEPFKRGFFRVCGGNALSLFQPEEIELLVRGSDEPLDISSLQAVAMCENWGVPNPALIEPVISWFWQTFHDATPKDQRKLLSFITGSDRIPAMGAANLVIKLSCLGDDIGRFPVARTCFNMLSLWRYESFAKLETMLWRAVHESEGFGLK